MEYTQQQKISLDQIDDPALAMRTDVGDEGIDELQSDMAEVGLIEPIVVRPKNGRYEIIAGHRRTTAARRLGWALIEAKVIEADDAEALRMRAIENLSRRDVDPVDEALYVAEVCNTQKLDDVQAAKLLHRSVDWVRTRLAVFGMPDYMQEHLKYRHISLGAALELAQIENETDRRYYVNYASVNGCTVSQARRWALELNSRPVYGEAARVEVVDEVGEVQHVDKVVACAACGGSLPLIEADSVWVHRRCPSSS